MKQIDGLTLKNMIVSGANNLLNQKGEVDALNIFPVPDGDTGTNMSLTLSAVADKLMELTEATLAQVADVFSNVSLRNARGNSGVITSQICRGMARVIGGSEALDCKAFAAALKEGADTAYRAIMRPTEGTILTVVRACADFAVENAENYSDVGEFFTAVIQQGNETLLRTPEMLPVLKSAGVVDAGGKGLLVFFEGACRFLCDGTVIERMEEQSAPAAKEAVDVDRIDADAIQFEYCTEYFVHLNKKVKIDRLKKSFEAIGDSLVLVEDGDVLKVHVHSNDPDIALGIGLKCGYLSDIKIDNMKVQARGRVDIKVNETAQPEEEKLFGFVSVSMGAGLSTLFEEMGVDVIIRGGQTMNPSTDDLLQAIDAVPAETVFVFPNNSNIIMAANQAKELSEKTVYVVPTKTITQAISCLLNLDFGLSPDEIFDSMTETIGRVKPASITYAARDSKVDGLKIKKGDVLGMTLDGIKFLGKDSKYVLFSLLDLLIDENSSLISVFYGDGVSEAEAETVQQELEEKYTNCDVSVYNGGQPLYYYFLSVE